jgi:rhamnulokinase
VLTPAALAANFTNEGGVDGRTRLLRNVMGLWILSETVRWWERDGARVDLPALLDAAADVSAAMPVFDVDDPRFLAPGDMPARIVAWCDEHGVPAPRTQAEFARSIVESLAQAFADAAATAARIGGVDVRSIHIVGGGSQGELLCQRTADRSGLPVLAGPVEATALGNILVQGRAAGLVSGSLEALRDLVARTHSPRIHQPR